MDGPDHTNSCGGREARGEVVMCPFCFATAAWIAAGVASTGSVSAAVIHSFRKNRQPRIEITRLRTAEKRGKRRDLEESRYVARRIHTS